MQEYLLVSGETTLGRVSKGRCLIKRKNKKMTRYQHPAPLLAVLTNFSKSRWVA